MPSQLQYKNQAGFTLLEMVVSIGIFSVVVITAIGIMINVSNGMTKAANIQAVQDNIRFSLELMTKEMRTGGNFSLTSVCGPAGSEISFDATSGRRIYFLDVANKQIMRAKTDITASDCNGNTGKVTPFTANEVFVDRLHFVLHGTVVGPTDGQPAITIVLTTRSKSKKIQLETSMSIQTTVIQRLRDTAP